MCLDERHKTGAADKIVDRTSRNTLEVRLHGVSMRPFEKIVDEHGAMVMRVCRAMLGAADADDAWSETFLAAMRAYPDLRPDSNIRGWLVTIARRKAIDQKRRLKRERPVDDLAETPTWDRHRSGDVRLRAAVQALPPKQQGAVIYHYLADLPYAQVGDLIGCSTAAARRSASDGIAALRTTYPREETT